MRAVKLHPSLHDYPADGEAYQVVYEAAGERGIPVTTHTWVGDKRCTPGLYVELAKEFPGTSFIMVHSGGSIKGVGEAIAAASKSDNVYLGTCGSLTFGIVEKMVEVLGSERIVFETDMPFIDPAAQLGKVIYAPIPDEAKIDILGRNAGRLLGL
jgi:predicted TIM-barrel fold metal-dependent hydrolase